MSIEGNDIGQSVIMAVDVADYDRFTEQDEAGTRARLKAHRMAASLLREKYRGEIVGAEGDTLLLVFPHAIAAVQYARDVQHLMFARNADARRSQRMYYRIGIHELERGVLESDGAEVATALMAVSDPGGICISGSVLDAARLKIFEQVVPVALPAGAAGMTGRAFNIELVYEEKGRQTGEDVVFELRLKAPRYALIAATFFTLVAASMLLVVQKPWRIETERASLERMAYALPERPSLVVLPFENADDNEEGRWLAEGFTEQVTRTLARESALFVIARNSAVGYAAGKGNGAVAPARAAEALGVRYVLRGSARRDGDNLQLDAVLVDTIEGYRMWSGSYDRPVSEFFAVRDKINQAVADELGLRLARENGAGALARSGNIEAFSLFTRGQRLFRRYNKADNAAARALFKQATAADPNHRATREYLAWTDLLEARLGWRDGGDQPIGEAAIFAARALDSSPTDVAARNVQELLRDSRHNNKAAIDIVKKAVALAPNSAAQLALLGQQYRRADRYGECETVMRRAMRLDPYYPDQYLSVLGDCAGMSGHFQDALPAFEEYQRRLQEHKSPDAWQGMIKLAWLHQKMGKENEAFRFFLAGKAMKPDLSEQAHLAPRPFMPQSSSGLRGAVNLVGAQLR